MARRIVHKFIYTKYTDYISRLMQHCVSLKTLDVEKIPEEDKYYYLVIVMEAINAVQIKLFTERLGVGSTLPTGQPQMEITIDNILGCGIITSSLLIEIRNRFAHSYLSNAARISSGNLIVSDYNIESLYDLASMYRDEFVVILKYIISSVGVRPISIGTEQYVLLYNER